MSAARPLFSDFRTWLRALRSRLFHRPSAVSGKGSRIETLCCLSVRSAKPAMLVPQLQVCKSPAACHLDRPVHQRPRHVLVFGDDAALIDERQRHAEPPEQAAPELDERQDADDRDRRDGPTGSACGGRRPLRRLRARRTDGTGGAAMLRDEAVPRRVVERLGHRRRGERDRRHHQATAAEGARSSTAERRLRGQDLAERREPEVAQQPPQPSLGPMQVAVVAEPAQRIGRQTRLLGIDLPRMEIEHRRLLLDAIQPIDAPPRPGVGQQPEVAAAGHRHRSCPRGARSIRHLHEVAGRTTARVKMWRGAVGMPYRSCRIGKMLAS